MLRAARRVNCPKLYFVLSSVKFVTVELPLFDERKPEYSLDRHLNKWLYFLKYLSVLDAILAHFIKINDGEMLRKYLE